MKKHVMELARQENSWAGYAWMPWLFDKPPFSVDDKVMEWANANNAFVYKHEVRSGEYVYDPPRYETNPERGSMKLCTHTKELVIYYYEEGDLPPLYHELLEFKRKLDQWENNG